MVWAFRKNRVSEINLTGGGHQREEGRRGLVSTRFLIQHYETSKHSGEGLALEGEVSN